MNQASSLKVALWNQAMLMKVVLSNQTSLRKVAPLNQTTPLKVARYELSVAAEGRPGEIGFSQGAVHEVEIKEGGTG